MDTAALALVIAGLAVAWLYFRRRPREMSSATDPAVWLKGPGTYEFPVLGISRYRPNIEKIYRDAPPDDAGKQVEAMLLPEEDEGQAVRVDVQGRTIGYLAPNVAREYHRRMVDAGHLKARALCRAKIIARHGSLGHTDFAVRLDLPAKRASDKVASPNHEQRR